MVSSLRQFKNFSFLNAINRSKVVTNNNSINQGMKTSSFVRQCTSNIATDSNVVFNPFCTLSPKNKKVEFENSKLSKINETEISKVILENSLAGDKHSSSLELKSSAKIKAQFDIFLQRKTEVEAEFEELLCYEMIVKALLGFFMELRKN